MSLSIPNARKTFLITWPHCDVPIEKIMELLVKDHPFGKTTYVVVSAESHQDGEQHRHAYVAFVEEHSIPRKQMFIFDIIRQWKLQENEVKDEVYMWITERYSMDDLKENEPWIPEAGKDLKEDIGEGFLRRWHPNIEPVGRNQKRAIKYVRKDGNFCSNGVCPYREEMTKAEKNQMLKSMKLAELVDKGEISLLALPALKKALDIYRDEHNKPVMEKKRVHWFYGLTGTGKTKTAWEEAMETYGAESIWCAQVDDKWFDGYVGQPAVIVDDLRASTWVFPRLLRLLDRYPMQVPVKGGFRNWIPREIWITAPGEPRTIYRNYTTGEPYEGIEQLERRIDDLREFTGGNSDTDEVEGFTQWGNAPA